MKVLVAGSEGSLMQSVIRRLLEMSHEIRGVDNFFRHGKAAKRRDYEFVEGDLCDRALVARAMQGVEYVFQGAARIFGVRGFHKFRADILSYDVLLHANILHEATRQNVAKIVYTSSSMVYEKCVRVPSQEDDVDSMVIPSTDYALSKLVGERMCRAFDKQYQLNYVIWRPFNIITPFEKGEAEPGISHVFADFARKIILEHQNPLEILGDGEQIRCFTWIEDVANAIAEYSFRAEADRKAFNLGNPEPITMKMLAEKIFKKARETGMIPGRETLQFRSTENYADDVKVRIPSIERAKATFGFTPTVKVDEALDFCLAEFSRSSAAH